MFEECYPQTLNYIKETIFATTAATTFSKLAHELLPKIAVISTFYKLTNTKVYAKRKKMQNEVTWINLWRK